MYKWYFLFWTLLSIVNVLKCAQAKVAVLNTTANDLNVIRKELFLMLKSSYNSMEIMSKELRALTRTGKRLSMISKEIEGNSFCVNMTRPTHVIYKKTLRSCFSKCIQTDK